MQRLAFLSTQLIVTKLEFESVFEALGALFCADGKQPTAHMGARQAIRIANLRRLWPILGSPHAMVGLAMEPYPIGQTRNHCVFHFNSVKIILTLNYSPKKILVNPIAAGTVPDTKSIILTRLILSSCLWIRQAWKNTIRAAISAGRHGGFQGTNKYLNIFIIGKFFDQN